MGQDVKEKHKNCDGCPGMVLLSKPDDIPTKVSSLGFRVWFSLLSVLVLGMTVKNPTSDSVISVLIFIIPLMREYYGFIPSTRPRRILRRVELAIIWVIVSICGLSIVNILEISGANLKVSDRFAVLSGKSFSFIIVWILLIAISILTVADYVAYKPKSPKGSKAETKLEKELLE
ncbi:hypothetical protein LI291_11815 [Intestinibacillus massiliensis]|nr:hypothetical protein [Intestinibacillus massiliensis]